MRRLNLFERDVVSIGDGGQLSEQEAEGIERLTPRLPEGLLKWERQALRFGPFCGVLCTSDVMIELLPKTQRDSQAPLEMRGVLIAMLAAAGELLPPKAGAADLEWESLHLLEVFIRDFCERVKIALRGGAIARYAERTENLKAIRGRLVLSEHLRKNAFDESQLLCRFDERTIDNSFNRILKAVLRVLLRRSSGLRTKAIVTSLLHRFDEIADRPVRVEDFDALEFDRTNERWREVFGQAKLLFSGLYPDARIGDDFGVALLFNMERLFEKVLGRRIERECRRLFGSELSVDIQRQKEQLATSGFALRPDIAIRDGDEVVAILDAKWKRLDPSPNPDVLAADAYQMNAYADRHRCRHLALVYPSSQDCRPGHVEDFDFQTPVRPILSVVAVDLRDLAFGDGIPAGLEKIISRETSRGFTP